MSCTVRYEEHNDVLYIKREGSVISWSDDFRGDNFTILNHDVRGDIVGMQIIAVSELSVAWLMIAAHMLPADIVAAWVEWRNSR